MSHHRSMLHCFSWDDDSSTTEHSYVSFSPHRALSLSLPLSLFLSLALSYSLSLSLVLSLSPPSLSPALSRKTQAPSADSCDPLASTGTLDLNPCGLVANSVFNDKIVVSSAPSPYDSLPPYEYMDESEISWVTGELT